MPVLECAPQHAHIPRVHSARFAQIALANRGGRHKCPSQLHARNNEHVACGTKTMRTQTNGIAHKQIETTKADTNEMHTEITNACRACAYKFTGGHKMCTICFRGMNTNAQPAKCRRTSIHLFWLRAFSFVCHAALALSNARWCH